LCFFKASLGDTEAVALGSLALTLCEWKVRSTTIGVDVVQRLKARRGKFLMASLSITGGTYGRREIVELSRKTRCK